MSTIRHGLGYDLDDGAGGVLKAILPYALRAPELRRLLSEDAPEEVSDAPILGIYGGRFGGVESLAARIESHDGTEWKTVASDIDQTFDTLELAGRRIRVVIDATSAAGTVNIYSNPVFVRPLPGAITFDNDEITFDSTIRTFDHVSAEDLANALTFDRDDITFDRDDITFDQYAALSNAV